MSKSKINEIAIYETNDGKVKVSVLFEQDNLWLTQKLMAALFECSVDNISLHLKNIFKDNELDKNSVVEYYSVTASDGKKYKQSITHLKQLLQLVTVLIPQEVHNLELGQPTN